MATSGSRNWIATRDNIIYAALRKIGVLESDQPPTATEVQNASFALNAMINAWQNDGVRLWTQAEEILPLTADTLSYSLDASVIGVEKPVFRRDDSDTELTLLTREEYYAISDKKQSGDPISIYVDYQLANPTAYLWPVPAYTTGMVVGTDALYYLCILGHTSSTDDTPITGTDYTTYWQAVSTTTTGVWADTTAYYSDVVRYTKVLRLQDFDVASNNPDFPVRWMQAMIYGLAMELSSEYSIPLQERTLLAQKFSSEYGIARRMDYDNTDLIVKPNRR